MKIIVSAIAKKGKNKEEKNISASESVQISRRKKQEDYKEAYDLD